MVKLPSREAKHRDLLLSLKSLKNIYVLSNTYRQKLFVQCAENHIHMRAGSHLSYFPHAGTAIYSKI